jgi:hypothetical protein
MVGGGAVSFFLDKKTLNSQLLFNGERLEMAGNECGA